MRTIALIGVFASLLLGNVWSAFAQLPKPVMVEPWMVRQASQNKDCQHWVDSVMGKLSLKEKVGQLFIFTISPMETKHNLDLLREVVETHKVGGLLYSSGEMHTQVALTNRAQQLAKVPLMITFDGEWGLAMRLKGIPKFPRNMVLGCIRDNHLLYEYGKEVARQCRQIGVHVNFAPVADVNINPKNPVINTRSFGEHPEWVSEKVLAYASGLESGRVLSVCKHFPGHGDTDVDSHKALPVLPFTRERLDSVELYPFKRAIGSGLGGMMVGHLYVPVLEATSGLPSSLSRSVVHDLLTEELGFNGLIFTDALAMKGVAGYGRVCLRALQAGNDMVLAPRNLKVEIPAVLKAVEQGELAVEEVERKCRKVLTYKYMLGLHEAKHLSLSGLEQRVVNEETHDLLRRLNEAAVVVLNNRNQVLPLYGGKEQTVALLELGRPGDTDVFANRLATYGNVKRFPVRPGQTEEVYRRLRDSLTGYKRIVVAVSESNVGSYAAFLSKLTPKIPVVYVFFTPGKTMNRIQQAVSRASSVVLGHTDAEEVQVRVADVLYAKAAADGRLSASLGNLFPAGAGVTVSSKSPVLVVPEEYGFSSALLGRIDSIALDGIKQGAFPGCQVVVLKQGRVMFNKAFGTQSGKGSLPVETTHLYDLASLSKTTGTLLALMKLYDKGCFNLTDKIADYLPYLKQTDKANITIQELLYHQSGLPSWLPFYQELIDKQSYTGRLFSAKRDARHTVLIGKNTWANPHFKLKEEFISPVHTGDYSIQLCEHLWLNRSFIKVMEQKIAEVPLKPKRYRYSDLGFLLLGQLVEQLAGKPMAAYLQQEFYRPMQLRHTTYLPLHYFSKLEIVPSNNDRFFRKEVLQGYVHDEACALFGGTGGNAGLFSNASEVARVYQMLLNGGELDGKRYLSRETCRLFTTSVSKISRRGLGFDKPDAANPEKGPCAACVPATVYGHTGFTGTCAWVDPDNELVYVFLSNRIYPHVTNLKLMQMDIREKIQETIYAAMKK